MKKLTIVTAALFLGLSANAQTFVDDFESYNSGDYLGVASSTWTTWSNAPGTSEDVQITTANAASGSNSIYFSSTAANGGPQDVILPFQQVYNSGNFTFEANFYVEANKGAYFNLQGTNTVAQIWALDCYMLDDGTMKLSNQGTPYLTANYPLAQWFNLRIEMDLSANIWELFIDNVSQGTFANPTPSIGILDLYPVNPTGEGGNGISGFYVDDVSYNHIPASLPTLNGAVTFVDQLSAIAGLTSNVNATVRNLGSDPITSFDLTYNYAGNNVTENITGVNILSLDTYDYTFASQVVTAAGSNNLTVTISNVNGGGADNDPSDDSKTITVNPITPANGKVVVGEEGTGTWCGWCPRGAVYMDLYEQEYDLYWAGIAVHNGDPMTNTIYDAGMGAQISGYPSALVDRGTDVDPSAMYTEFINRLQTPPNAFITNQATWNAGTRELQVTVSAEFQGSANNSWAIACVLTEDSVTGTASGYAQTNYYSGGSNGNMGGYESLPNPVPAAQMVYDHVAREIQPSYDGSPSTLPATVNSGETHTATFNFTLPVEWNENNINIIGMLIDPSGRIDNAGKSTIFSNSGIEELEETTFRLFPNPAGNLAFVEVANDNDAEIAINVLDLSGKVIAERNYGMVTPGMQLPIVTSNFDSGLYIVQVVVDGKVGTKRLVVE